MVIKLLVVGYTESRIEDVWGETNNILLAHKGKTMDRLSEALCTYIPLFPASEREEQEERKRDGERER